MLRAPGWLIGWMIGWWEIIAIHASKLADVGSCKRLGLFPSPREQKSPRTNGRRKTMEPIWSTPLFSCSLFSTSLSLFFLFRTFSFFFPPLLLNPPTKPLLLVSDFYLVAPGPRFISWSSLSFSLEPFSSPFLVFFVTPSLSPTNSPQPRTVRNFLFRISDP